MQIIGRDSDKH